LINTGETWEPAEFFTQQDINDGNIKYVHNLAKTTRESDILHLKIFADDFLQEDKVEVQFNILKVELHLTSKSIDITTEKKIIFTPQLFNIELWAITGQLLSPNKVEFSFSSLPSIGRILLKGQPIRQNQLILYSDVLENNVAMEIDEEIRKQFVDIILVKIKLDALEHLEEFKFNYLPDPEKIFIINNPLQIDEGNCSLFCILCIFYGASWRLFAI
jgi:hypothetical protein